MFDCHVASLFSHLQNSEELPSSTMRLHLIASILLFAAPRYGHAIGSIFPAAPPPPPPPPAALSSLSAPATSSIASSFGGVQNNEENLVPGIIGWYQIDLSVAPKNRDTSWDTVQITWNAATNAFTWANKAGVSWTLKPISGKGGWDTTQLTVGNDNPYYQDGYTTAKIEWASRTLSNLNSSSHVPSIIASHHPF